MSVDLHGAALVTGSSRGIGRATAVALARRGFSVVLNGYDDQAELDQAVQPVRDEGVAAFGLAGDIADGNFRQRLLDFAEESIGPLTTLINNAGVSVMHRGDLLDVSEESFDRCLSVNTKALFFLSQAFAKRLLSRERTASTPRSIINITSSNAVAASVTRGEYCASKAAAAMVSKLFAIRLADEGIQVFDVQPGLIDTQMARPARDSYQRRIDEDGLTLIRRLGQPEDVANIVATLATGGLPYTAGQVISADAGLLVPRF
jgi:NAD(P)-dependent dehydrogenase (short-subunit alcohol dehydrogenase family)